ncbi:MAG: hypothetical protein ACWGNV_04965 [Bacteroidales bacterium]
MKSIRIIILGGLLLAGICSPGRTQSLLNAGIGYFGEGLTSPGVVLEVEYEKRLTDDFSLPWRGDVGYHNTPDYHAFIVDIHKGFRKYWNSGLFVEQSVGAGIITKSFKEEDYWYRDTYANSIPHGNHMIWGFMPSVTLGAGYNLSKGNQISDLLWIRPKIYWDLGFRGLHLPYFALQAGYTHTFKSK